MENSSRRLRLKDLRDVYRLVGECCERGADPLAWHARMAEGLSDLLNCRIGLSGMTGCTNLTEVGYNNPADLGVYDWGFSSPQDRQGYLDYCNRGMAANDPTLLAISQIRARVVCRRRCDLVDDDVWYASPHQRDYFRHWRIGDFLYSVSYPAPETGVFAHWINVGRDETAPRFTVRDRRLLLLFVVEVHRELGRRLAPFGRLQVPQLSPRQLQVLQWLTESESEKEIAQQMGLSRHTVHDYVKEIYRRFEVSSRVELIAKWQEMSSSGFRSGGVE